MKRINFFVVIVLLLSATSTFARQQIVSFSWDLDNRIAPRGVSFSSAPDSTLRLPTVEEVKFFVKHLYRGPRGEVGGVPVRFLTHKKEQDSNNVWLFYVVGVDGKVKKIHKTAPAWLLWIKDTQK